MVVLQCLICEESFTTDLDFCFLCPSCDCERANEEMSIPSKDHTGETAECWICEKPFIIGESFLMCPDCVPGAKLAGVA